jgi:hypothetical protein
MVEGRKAWSETPLRPTLDALRFVCFKIIDTQKVYFIVSEFQSFADCQLLMTGLLDCLMPDD